MSPKSESIKKPSAAFSLIISGEFIPLLLDELRNIFKLFNVVVLDRGIHQDVCGTVFWRNAKIAPESRIGGKRIDFNFR